MLQSPASSDNVGNNPLHSACVQQLSAAGNILKLVKEQKKDNEAALSKIAELEKSLMAKEKELEMHKNAVRVLRQMQDEDCQGKFRELNEVLKEKSKTISLLVQLLNKKLEKNKDWDFIELNECCDELRVGLEDLLKDQSHIGIKVVGELNRIPFEDACKRKYPSSSAMIKASELWSLWNENLGDQSWEPFKEVCEEHGSAKCISHIIDEDDKKLQELRYEWGDGIYAAVTRALKERFHYSPERLLEREVWNYKKEGIATLNEVVQHVISIIRQPKRKRIAKSSPVSDDYSKAQKVGEHQFDAGACQLRK